MSTVEDFEAVEAPARRMSFGTTLSVVGHVVLIGWLLLGWGLSHDPVPFDVTEVSVVSGEEYAALVAATTPQADTSQPAAPEVPEAPETLPTLATPEEPVTPLTPAPEQPTAEVEVAPFQPEPPPPPVADVTDTVPELAQPEPPAPPPSAAIPSEAPRPVPRPAPRIAPEAAAPPPPEAEIDPVVQQEAAPDAAADLVEEPAEEAAPEEAATEVVTEAEIPSGAVEVSSRPQSRPVRPAQAAPASDPAAAAVAAAVAAASTASAQPGPPLTGSELNTFRVSVQGCWVVDQGSLAASVTVTLAFELTRDGRVAGNEVIMIGNSGGTPAAVQAAYESARRAVLRCQSDGFPLPAEKYDQWRLVEMTFNPAEMRIR